MYRVYFLVYFGWGMNYVNTPHDLEDCFHMDDSCSVTGHFDFSISLPKRF